MDVYILLHRATVYVYTSHEDFAYTTRVNLKGLRPGLPVGWLLLPVEYLS